MFGSYDTFVTTNKRSEENKFETLLSIPEIRNECDKLVQVYKMESTEGIKNPILTLEAITRINK